MGSYVLSARSFIIIPVHRVLIKTPYGSVRAILRHLDLLHTPALRLDAFEMSQYTVLKHLETPHRRFQKNLKHYNSRIFLLKPYFLPLNDAQAGHRQTHSTKNIPESCQRKIHLPSKYATTPSPPLHEYIPKATFVFPLRMDLIRQ